MRVEILYRPAFPVAPGSLEQKEKAQVESDTRLGMSADMQMKTEAKGGFLKSISRALFGGESFFMNPYMAEKEGDRLLLAVKV